VARVIEGLMMASSHPPIRRLAAYEITAALGAGGMGEVWRATDTRLGREVALKILPADMAADPERLDRFDREARAVASLNHPHIVTIHSVEEADGIRFLTMELIEGHSLDALIPQGGFDLDRFFALATPLSEAISAAHDKSVIHRDLKPSNVMVDADGRVKVLDFGLAKLHGPEGVSESSALATEALTGVGTIVGTVPYMSPEQIEGKIVDHRSDIFSLGVLMYEMATGERPFTGDSSPGLMSSILKDTPTSVLEIRSDLPRHLGRIIGRCLEKDRRDRYQTARDVFNELKALRHESRPAYSQASRPAAGAARSDARPASVSSSPARGDVPWIAVLPLGCPRGDTDVEAFADGLEEDIATGLSRFSYLFVVARKSTRRYRGEATDVRQVGDELGARYVMEGGIRRAGSRVRVGLNLIDSATGTHLWSETYDRDFDMSNIFELQDEITDRVVATVADPHGALTRSMALATGSKPAVSLSSHEAVLRNLLYRQRISAEDHLITRAALEHAAAHDSNNAEVLAALAGVYIEEANHDFNPQPDPLGRALATARRAVEADPASQMAHFYLAQAHFHRQNLSAFRAAANRALELNRRSTDTMAMIGILLGYAGDWDAGVDLVERAMELNPLHPGWYRFSPFMNAYRMGRDAEALEIAQQINMPEYWGDPLARTLALAQLGDSEGTQDAVCDLLRVWPRFESDYKRVGLEPWVFAVPELEARILEGLGKAGLHVAGASPRPDHRKPPSSATVRAVAAGPASPPDTVAIAVLPFADMSPDKDQDYLCEGMAEEIMNALVHVEGIQVASRTSTFRAVEGGQDLRAIGRALSVGQVLEGSVRLAGSRLRVTAQLTEIDSGYQLWSERFDRDATDVFTVQDEIAAGVVDAVTSRLTPAERTIRERRQVGDLEAYRHYLRGRHFRYSKNDHASALAAYDQALAVDPAHAPSWVGKAEVTVLAAVYSLVPSLEAYAAAKDALATARRLQGESVEGSYVEGMIALCERRWPEAETALLRAVELEPTFVQGLAWTGFLYSVLRRWEDAEGFFRRGCELDPLAPYPYAMMACGLLANGRSEEACDAAEQAIQFDGENTLALWSLGMARVALGRFDEGVAALEKAASHARRRGFILGVLGWGLAAAGRRDDARAVLDELAARDRPAPTVVGDAWIRAVLGDVEGAWRTLDRAVEERQAILAFAGFPPFDALRPDPRYAAFLERLGLPPAPPLEPSDTAPDDGPHPEKSIAVLPFVNLSPDADNEYFSDGLTEEIIADLAKIGALRVTSRTSVMQLKGAKKPVRDIGRELGVRYVLEGGVRKAGNALRITAQLVDAGTDAQLWSEKFSGTMDDVFEVQERVSREIVAALDVRLSSDENRRLAERPITHPRVFELYLQARQEIRRFDAKALERAESLLAQAVEIEGETPPLVNLLAYAKVAQVKAGGNPDLQALDAAEAQALALLERTPDLPQAHALLGSIAYERGQQPQAVWHCRRALEGNSNDADALLYLGAAYMAAGQPEEGLEAGRRMVACDPLASISWMILGAALWFVGRPNEAVPHLERSLELDPQNLLGHWGAGYTYATLGRLSDAARHADVLEEHGRENPYGRQLVSLVAALEGRREEALRVLEGLDLAPLDPHTVFHLSESFAMAGDTHRAIELLGTAVEQGFYPYPFLNAYCPFMAPLRPLPGFESILESSREKTASFREEGPTRPRRPDGTGDTT
jgi:TolB-like protein/Flp pilus assembly protein TadD